MSLYLDHRAREIARSPFIEQQTMGADTTKKGSYGYRIQKVPRQIVEKLRTFQPLPTIPEGDEPDELPQHKSDYRKRIHVLDPSDHSSVNHKKNHAEQLSHNGRVCLTYKQWSKIKRFGPIGGQSNQVLVAINSIRISYINKVPKLERTAKFKHKLKRSNNLQGNENRNPNVTEITPVSTKRKELPTRLRDLNKPYANKKGCYAGNDEELSKLLTNLTPF